MMRKHVAVLLFVTAFVAPTRAQDDPTHITMYDAPVNIQFMSGPIAFDAEPVSGAPYSADAITDVVQTLSDGNRIVRQNTAQISRDSQGRTRREEGFAVFGPLVKGPLDNSPRNVQISDPTTGATIMLDLQSKTAHKMPAPPRPVLMRSNATGAGAATTVRVERMNVENFEIALPAPEARGGVMFNRVEAVAGVRAEKPVVESLGTQFMEGFAVEGTRTTVTIPAGQIGNELPINVVSERWVSPELKVLVMSRQSDPRFGETTYRLTNITRVEPSPELFQVPADFKVLEPAAGRPVMIERKIVK
jgi:hypothetical protein